MPPSPYPRFRIADLTGVATAPALLHVPESSLRRYLQTTRGAKIALPPGEVFVHEGAQSPGMFLVLHGIVELYTADERGKEKTQDFVQPDSALGSETLFNNQPLPYSARSLTDVTLLHLSARIIADWIDAYPAFAGHLMASAAQRIDFLNKDILTLRTKKATARIVCYLLCHFNRAPRTADGSYSLEVPIPRNKLASRLGITGAHLSRAFRELQDAGLLIPKGKGYFIPNVPQLSRYVCPKGCDFGDD